MDDYNDDYETQQIIPIGPKIDIRPAITILTKCATFLIAAALSFFAFLIAFSRNRLVAAFAIFPAYGMPNCTAYAFGRIYELNGSRPNLCTGNAEMLYDYNKSHNYYPYGSTPKLGAVAVWVHPGGGHVAVVEKIENNTVTYSNSAYNGTNFYLSTAPLSDPGNVGATDWTLQGYIYAYTPPISNTSSGIVNYLSAPQFEGK